MNLSVLSKGLLFLYETEYVKGLKYSWILGYGSRDFQLIYPPPWFKLKDKGPLLLYKYLKADFILPPQVPKS